jgi:hypothetical protein
VELSQTDGDVALGDVRLLTRGATSHGPHMSVAAHQGNVRQRSRFPPKHTNTLFIQRVYDLPVLGTTPSVPQCCMFWQTALACQNILYSGTEEVFWKLLVCLL